MLDAGNGSIDQMIEFAVVDNVWRHQVHHVAQWSQQGFVAQTMQIDLQAPPLGYGIRSAGFLVGHQFNRCDHARLTDIGDLWMIDAWVANDAWISANPVLARRFSEAMRQAAVWANRNHDKTAELISAATKIDLAVVQTMRRAVFLEHVNLSVVQPVIDVGTQYGALNARFPAADLFYPGALH